MPYFLLLILALSPSIIWLLFFLRKDSHPESNQMILKIFFYGILAAPLAALVEIGLFEKFSELAAFLSVPSVALISALWVALIEESFKYLAVKEKVLNNPEFDEPTDAMLYMIIAALGFAAFENVLILLPLGSAFLIKGAALSALRFVGATFLHALCSGLVGYFLALSFFETKKRWKLMITGLGIAVLLHAFYNFSIMTIEGNARFILPSAILIVLALAVSLGFKKLKKIASVCKIK